MAWVVRPAICVYLYQKGDAQSHNKESKHLSKNHNTVIEKRNQPCRQVHGKNLNISEVDKCMRNQSTVTRTEREEPSDCKPISFQNEHHPLLLELQQLYTKTIIQNQNYNQ